MQITLSPQAANEDTTVSVNGLTITINDIPYGLSVIPEGGDAQPEDNEPFVGTMTRASVTVLFKYDSVTAEPNQSTDIADYTFDITSGDVPDPIIRKPEEPTDAD